jgi:hypothetical protein
MVTKNASAMLAWCMCYLEGTESMQRKKGEEAYMNDKHEKKERKTDFNLFDGNLTVLTVREVCVLRENRGGGVFTYCKNSGEVSVFSPKIY